MAEDLELEMDEEKGGKGKLIIIIVAVVVLLGGGAGAFFFLSGDAEPEPVLSEPAESGDAAESKPTAAPGSAEKAMYVAMPRPFVFNVSGGRRDRLVQIKVQMLVRGSNNESTAKKHIPLLEGTLLRVFSTATVEELSTLEGKEALRDQALSEVKKAMVSVEGTEVVERVLFTGFVMQ